MMRRRKPSVLVGMSGGVDSSVAAALLVKRGYTVVGGFIKNWSDTKDLWTGECAWRGERRDAMRVAAKLKIPLLTFDFEKAYREKVVAEMLRGYETGITPNPDVLCNEFIKFGLFADEAERLGFDAVATGHYARIRTVGRTAHLLRGMDPDKDQSYFLYRVPQGVLRKTLFPIGHLRKAAVRTQARAFDLPVAGKPDSQGICFIGKLDMETFLRKKIPSKPGDIVDASGTKIGRHDGLDLYTIGQRQGIKVSKGGEAWYVAAKDVAQNRLIVVPGASHPLLTANDAQISDLHWTRGRAPRLPMRCEVQVRYRQPPVKATIRRAGTRLHISFDASVKAVAPGQSAVLYTGAECLGGGVILPRLAA